MTPVLLWLFLCEQKKKFEFDFYCNKMHMYCLKIAEKILCIANAQEILKRLDLPFLCIFDPGLLFKIFSTLAPF